METKTAQASSGYADTASSVGFPLTARGFPSATRRRQVIYWCLFHVLCAFSASTLLAMVKING